ncbi:MAG: hypothetical protein KAU06_03685 [Candidatus Marinimicrobia bacterium]|nr:hypothetical protein [Candidatus Neomarinimicrobiota bacterium]
MTEIEIVAGTKIDDAANEMIEVAKSQNCQIRAIFNSVPIVANPHTSKEQILTQYHYGTIQRDKLIKEVKDRGFPNYQNATCGQCVEPISAFSLESGHVEFSQNQKSKWCRKRRLWIEDNCPACKDFAAKVELNDKNRMD